MDHANYRQELRAHAVKLGFDEGRQDGPRLVFTHSSGATAIVDYAPAGTPLINYLRSNKGVLTSAHNTATGKPGREWKPPRRDPRWQLPSENMWEDWIFANHDPTMPVDGDASDNAGKWVIFLRRRYVDEVWAKVRDGTLEGHLRFAAKISTRRGKLSFDDSHVLCVYTADAADIDDAMRIRDRLRDLGFKRKIPYKPNSMTRALEHGSSFSA